MGLICSQFGYIFFLITCSTSTTQLKTITAQFCALGVVEYAVVEFLFDGELVWLYLLFGFETMNGGWMGVFRFILISKWVSIYVLYCVKTCHGAQVVECEWNLCFMSELILV